ncbi:hypothetical protein LCGC14_2827570 [marine sediment metagenome]|uniref:Cytidyltransferase-like domain-containing protein n=1 Tax=marine sediment metagenome TaxID=412755 RepID=A0A0F8YF14_9ZZZZ
MSHKVLVPGTFDLLHYGHMRFLEECAKHGYVTVALATDAHAHPKRKPIMTYYERREALLHLSHVDKIVPKYEHSLWPIIMKVQPASICYGSDWAKPEWMRMNGLKDDVSYGGGIRIIEILNPMVISTTEIIERVKR